MGGRSAGSRLNSTFKRTEEEIKKGPMIFGTAAFINDPKNGNSYVDIDGYLYARNENELLTKLAKTVDLYDKGEGDALRSAVGFNEIVQYPPTRNEQGRWDGGYILEWEPVSGASRWNEEKDEMEYSNKRANYYVHIRFGR